MEYLNREKAYEREKRSDFTRWIKFQETGACLSSQDMAYFFDELLAKARAAQK